MAEESQKDDLEKSEEATPKRREDARKRGQFPRSRSLIPAATLLMLAVALRYGGESMLIRLGECFVGFFSAAGTLEPLRAEDIFLLGAQAGGLVETGVRLKGEKGAIDLFLGYERRVDAAPLDRQPQTWIFVGFRLVGG